MEYYKEKVRLAEYEALEKFNYSYNCFSIEEKIMIYRNNSNSWQFEYNVLRLMGQKRFANCMINGYTLGEPIIENGKVAGSPFFLLTDDNVKELARKLQGKLDISLHDVIRADELERYLREIFEL